MKPQDIVFGIVFIALILLRREKLYILAGLLCFVSAIPLFATWTFFTAERLVWYGAAFIFVGIIVRMVKGKENVV